MNKLLIKSVQFIATFALLGLVFYQVGLFSPEGQTRFLGTLKNAHWPLLLASVAIGIFVNMTSAFKWYWLAKSQHLGAGYWRIFAYYIIGQFYNMFLPTSVGGDFIRSYELGKFSGRQADSMASVFVERYTGVLMLLVFASIAVISQLSRLNDGVVVLSLIFFAFALALIGWLVLDQRFYRAVSTWLSSKEVFLKRLFAKVDRLLSSVDAYRAHPRAIVWAFVNSVFFYLAAVINVYITAMVFNVDVALLPMLIATPIIMLIMNLPISFGNIGLMEFAYTSVFLLLGYSAELGLSVAILMRLKSFLDGAMGGVLHPIFVTKKHE